MNTRRNPMAGGFILAVAAMAGFFIGARNGQMSAGLLIGVGVGVVIALAVWVIDQRR